MSTLRATPVTAARTIGRSRRLIHVQIAAANAASPTIDHTIDPAIATDTPAIAVTAHHGAVADAHVTSPTDRMISTASGTVEPVGDASLSAAASPATAAVTSAPALSTGCWLTNLSRLATRRAAQPHRRATLPPRRRRYFPSWVPQIGTEDGKNDRVTRRQGRGRPTIGPPWRGSAAPSVRVST